MRSGYRVQRAVMYVVKSLCEVLLWVGVGGVLASCAPSFFPEYAAQIKEPVSLLQAKPNPTRYTGSLVIWGGKIVNTTNRREGTYLEVLELPLDAEGKPREGYRSDGRFVAFYQGFLDPAIYHPNRKVTLAGRIQGAENITIGETTHVVPRINAERIHLWEEEKFFTSRYGPCDGTVCIHGGWYWWGWRHCCW